jgi:hypothetical protein
MNINNPIFYHQNERIQIFNPQLWLLSICDGANNDKDLFYFNLWPPNAKGLQGKVDQFQWLKSPFGNVKIAIYYDIIVSMGDSMWLMI